MKKFAFIFAAIVATAVHAEDADNTFEKFSVYGNFNHITSSTKLTVSNVSLDGVGTSATGLSIGADKGFAMGEKGILLVGAEAMLGSPNYMDMSVGNAGFTAKQKSGYSVYVAPGLKASENTLLYFKLGLEQLKLEGTGGGTTSYSGSSYGVGSRINLDSRLFVTIEFKQTSYSEKDQTTPKATIGTVGLGYHF